MLEENICQFHKLKKRKIINKKAKNINMDPRKDNSSMPKTNTSGIRAISNDDNPNKLRVKWKK